VRRVPRRMVGKGKVRGNDGWGVVKSCLFCVC
jgi:hypothetical protein